MRVFSTIALTLALTISTYSPALAIGPGTGQSCSGNTLSMPTEDGKVLIPTGANPETTPTILIDGYWIPEESPNGTYPTGEWLDNSPVYSGGWYLQVNDSTLPPTLQWHKTDEEQYDFMIQVPEGL